MRTYYFPWLAIAFGLLPRLQQVHSSTHTARTASPNQTSTEITLPDRAIPVQFQSAIRVTVSPVSHNHPLLHHQLSPMHVSLDIPSIPAFGTRPTVARQTLTASAS